MLGHYPLVVARPLPLARCKACQREPTQGRAPPRASQLSSSPDSSPGSSHHHLHLVSTTLSEHSPMHPRTHRDQDTLVTITTGRDCVPKLLGNSIICACTRMGHVYLQELCKTREPSLKYIVQNTLNPSMEETLRLLSLQG